MPDFEQVHRFREHVVAGVNWRPTRFVDKVPSSLVCCLCRMIPNAILALPCGHNLCQSCCSAESQDAGKRCPLDQGTFKEVECIAGGLSATEAKSFKVRCWNEAHGCTFEGSIEDMLRHFENQCTRHAIECWGCGKQVLHTALSKHYTTKCSTSGSMACKGFCSPDLTSEDPGATSDDLSNADLQALFRNPKHDQLLSAIRSQMNELTEQFGKHQSSLAEVAREVSASQQILKAQIEQVAATISSTVSDQLRSWRNPAEENPTTSASSLSSLPLRSEKTLILRKLEVFADTSLRTLEHLRQTSTAHGPRRVSVRCKPVRQGCDDWRLTNGRTTVRSWGEVSGLTKYHVVLENCDEKSLSSLLEDAAQITVLHMRDAYFTLLVFGNGTELVVRIAFHGMLAGTPCPPPVISVKALGTSFLKPRVALTPCRRAYPCDQDGDSLVHFHREFRTDFKFLKNNGFLEDGEMHFEVELSHREIVPAARTRTSSA